MCAYHVGCPACGRAMATVSSTSQGDTVCHRLACEASQHGRWVWVEGAPHLTSEHDPLWRARLAPPGPIRIQPGDFVITATHTLGEPSRVHVAFEIWVWDEDRRVGELYPTVEAACDAARRWAHTVGVRLWVGHRTGNDRWQVELVTDVD